MIEITQSGTARNPSGARRVPAGRRPPAGDLYDTATVIDLQVTAPSDDTRVIKVVGDIDMLTAPVLDSMVVSQLQSWLRTLILDLSAVGFMSSAGLASLIAAREETAEAGVTLLLAGAGEPVVRPLAVTGLIALFDLHDDLESALGA